MMWNSGRVQCPLYPMLVEQILKVQSTMAAFMSLSHFCTAQQNVRPKSYWSAKKIMTQVMFLINSPTLSPTISLILFCTTVICLYTCMPELFRIVETLFATNVRKCVASFWRYLSTTILSVQNIDCARLTCSSLLGTPSILTVTVAAVSSWQGMVGGILSNLDKLLLLSNFWTHDLMKIWPVV